jgi:hypothetical protein
MHKHLSTLTPRLLNPITNRLKLRLERINPVVANALDIQNLDPAFALFYPERALSAWAFTSDELGTAACGAVTNYASCCGVAVVVRWDECTFAD